MADNKVDLIYKESEKAFLAETTRKDKLTDTAERYLAAVALILGFKLIEFERIVFVGSTHEVVSSVLAIGAYALFGIALMLALLTMRIMKYTSYPRGETLIDELQYESITDDEAKIKLAKMYLSAHDNNARINDQRAKLLSWSSVFLVLGFGLTVASQIITRLAA